MGIFSPEPLSPDDPLFLAVRDALPWWAPWAGSLTWWIACSLASALGTWIGLWWAARPIRRVAGKDWPAAFLALHWTERARLRAGVARASGYCALVFPVLAAVGAAFGWGPLHATGQTGHVVGCIAFAVAGNLIVAVRAQKRDPVLPVTWPQALRGWVAQWTLFATALLVTVVAALLMPPVPDARAWAVTGGALIVLGVAVLGGVLVPLRWLRIVVPADERLLRIVRERAAQEGREPPGVEILRAPMANAMALPSANRLLVTEWMAEEFPDDELAAIVGHEMGHLAESRRVRILRFLRGAAFLPFAWIVPLLNTEGFFLALVPGLLGQVLIWATIGVSRRLEHSADHHAHAHGEIDPAALARGLERLARRNESPVVTGSRLASHPDVYDRMLAAGVEPDYPRPAPPRLKTSILGAAVAALVIALSLVFAWDLAVTHDTHSAPPSRAAYQAALHGGDDPWTLSGLAGNWDGQGRHDDARVARRAAVALTRDPWTAGELIAIQFAVGDEEGARAAYDRWTDVAEPSRVVDFWLAWRWCRTAFELGRHDAAAAWLAAALVNLDDPSDPAFAQHLAIGALRARLESPESARPHAEAAARAVNDATDPWSIARVAFLFHDAGLDDRVESWIERARERGRETGNVASVEAYIRSWREEPMALR